MNKFIEIPVLNEGKCLINVDAIQALQSTEKGKSTKIHFLAGNVTTIQCTLPYEELVKLLSD